LLDTTRAYALEKLEEHAEFDAICRRHAEYERRRRMTSLDIQEDCRSDCRV
jgi:predicted ATPase